MIELTLNWRMPMKRNMLCLILMGSLIAQSNSKENQYPKEIVPFEITEHDIADIEFRRGGEMLVEFEITESGHVENPVVIDSFNTHFNIVVLDKVRQSRYTPARQNGRPVRVKYRLPIKVKK
tara:strand:+ start:680 stop:1045 length:366 start_codon:yes stop_codon:yes gene_type:complete